MRVQSEEGSTRGSHEGTVKTSRAQGKGEVTIKGLTEGSGAKRLGAKGGVASRSREAPVKVSHDIYVGLASHKQDLHACIPSELMHSCTMTPSVLCSLVHMSLHAFAQHMLTRTDIANHDSNGLSYIAGQKGTGPCVWYSLTAAVYF